MLLVWVCREVSDFSVPSASITIRLVELDTACAVFTNIATLQFTTHHLLDFTNHFLTELTMDVQRDASKYGIVRNHSFNENRGRLEMPKLWMLKRVDG